MPDTKESPQGSGKQIMSKGFVKVGTNGNGSNGSNGSTMAVVKEVPANGDVAVIEEAVAEVVKEEIPEVVEKVVEKPKFVPVITVDQRIEKVDELNITIAKWKTLQAARKGLTNFRLGSDGMSSTLELKDADGQPFRISNPIVVEAAVAHIRQVLNEKIAETEAEINFSL